MTNHLSELTWCEAECRAGGKLQGPLNAAHHSYAVMVLTFGSDGSSEYLLLRLYTYQSTSLIACKMQRHPYSRQKASKIHYCTESEQKTCTALPLAEISLENFEQMDPASCPKGKEKLFSLCQSDTKEKINLHINLKSVNLLSLRNMNKIWQLAI